jgi:hypothetical protein
MSDVKLIEALENDPKVVQLVRNAKAMAAALSDFPVTVVENGHTVEVRLGKHRMFTARNRAHLIRSLEAFCDELEMEAWLPDGGQQSTPSWEGIPSGDAIPYRP